MKKSLSTQAVVNQIFSLYEKFGSADYIGEPVSQLEHMSQAASLAMAEGHDDEVVLAAFFHDIGHLCANGEAAGSMDGLGNVNHEQIGADYLLELGFSPRLAKLVSGHVIAKRYLTSRCPEYYEKLSPASKVTLDFQGGPMSEEEASAFEKDPDADILIRLRHWDDEAKLINVAVDNLPALKALAIKHLEHTKSLMLPEC